MVDEIKPEEVQEVMDENLDPDWIKNQSQPLPESPASLNVKFWADGYGVQLTMRATTVSEVLKQFQVILPFIKNAGYKEVWDKEPVTRVLPQEAPAQTQAPICGIHGTPMTWKQGISKSSGKPYAFFGTLFGVRGRKNNAQQ